jgi:hypothetical protein
MLTLFFLILSRPNKIGLLAASLQPLLYILQLQSVLYVTFLDHLLSLHQDKASGNKHSWPPCHGSRILRSNHPWMESLKRNCTQHAQTVLLLSFPEQYSVTTIYIVFTLH